MKENLKELMLKAGTDTSGKWLSIDNTQKFAELLVEELRNVLAEEYRKTPLECAGHLLRADEAISEYFYGPGVHE